MHRKHLNFKTNFSSLLSHIIFENFHSFFCQNFQNFKYGVRILIFFFFSAFFKEIDDWFKIRSIFPILFEG
jgi:hypothetical protein